MAEETKQTDAKSDKGNALEREASRKGSLLGWMILFSVVVAGATGGFALSQLVGGAAPAAEPQAGENPDSTPSADVLPTVDGSAGDSWSYDQVEPVVANLDEPGVSRYIRATVMFEVSGKVEQAKMEAFLTEKNPVIKDWLTTYFAGLSLEDVRGSRNLSRIKQEIQDRLNEILFPESRPLIKRVLFKEFAVQ